MPKQKRRESPGQRRAKETKAGKPELVERRRRFVEAYMGEAAGNASEAYRIAYGESASPSVAASEAWRLLRNPKVRAAIDKRVADDPLVATRHQLQRRLTAVALGEDRGSTAYDSEGNRVDRWGSKVSDEVRAAELLLKTRAEVIENHKHTGSLEIKPVAELTADELIARARRLAAKREGTQ